jgi:NAD/NADP transhydrogenase beta subunit
VYDPYKIARRTFNKILAMMATDWKENSSADFSRRATISKAILSHNFSNFCFGGVSIASIFYTGSVFAFNTLNIDKTDISMRPLILKMDFPFNTDIRFMYEFLLFLQILCTVFSACCNIMVNTLLIVLVSKLKLT